MKKHTHYSLFAFIMLILSASSSFAQTKLEFPPLPYAFDALEPYIDTQTMKLHYEKHHRTYYENLVKAIKGTPLEGMTLLEMMRRVSQYPISVRNNGGGHFNHVLFWKIMTPEKGLRPQGRLAELINRDFGSFADFKNQFEKTALSRFGSGWAWLSLNDKGQLFISSTANQDNPLMDVVEEKGEPILGLDLWEHAYYLKYQNRRMDYVANFWSVVNWDEVGNMLVLAEKGSSTLQSRP